MTSLTSYSYLEGVKNESFKQKNVDNSICNEEKLTEEAQKIVKKQPFPKEYDVRNVKMSKLEIYPLREDEEAVCMYCN